MGQIPLSMLEIKDHPQKTRAKECLDPIDTALKHPYVMDRSGRAEGDESEGIDG